jgi:DNA repair photolyase
MTTANNSTFAFASEGAQPVSTSGKRPRLNADGFSVEGCKMIYAPAGQAGEYSKLATNPFRGCGHACVYCYVPSVIKMDREEFDAGATPRKNYLRELRKDAEKYRELGIREQVMLSFTTDPFNPDDAETGFTRETIKIIIEHGLDFCTLTKGGRRALRDIDLFRPDRDAFASTLTSLDDDVSRRWEPNAALPGDRLETLQAFHARGVYTWVSLEPVYDTEATLEIIRRTSSFVNLFKVGRINYSKMTARIDWREFTERVLALLAETGADHYIKKDLQPYLPAGYQNNKYRKQSRELPVIQI